MVAVELRPNYTLAQTLEGNMAESLRGPVFVQTSAGCEVLLEDAGFLWITQELVNNCVEKRWDGIVEVALTLTCDPFGRFIMTIEDNVTYPPYEAAALVADLNSDQPERKGKKRREISDEGTWKLVPACRRIFTAWGGSLVYHATEDHRIVAEAHWTKQGFLTVPPPPLSAEELENL